MAQLVGGYHAHGDQIVDLIEIDFLRIQLFPNRVKPLHASFNAHERHLGLTHLLLDGSRDVVEKSFISSTSLLKLRGQLAVIVRMKILEREVLELAAQLAHAEAMRK